MSSLLCAVSLGAATCAPDLIFDDFLHFDAEEEKQRREDKPPVSPAPLGPLGIQ